MQAAWIAQAVRPENSLVGDPRKRSTGCCPCRAFPKTRDDVSTMDRTALKNNKNTSLCRRFRRSQKTRSLVLKGNQLAGKELFELALG